jgi:hypothetical protein
LLDVSCLTKTEATEKLPKPEVFLFYAGAVATTG